MNRHRTIMMVAVLVCSLARADQGLTSGLAMALKGSRTNGVAGLTEGYRGELKTVFRWGVAARVKDEHPRETMEFTHLDFDDRGVGNRCPPVRSILVGLADPRTGEMKGYRAPTVFIPNLPTTELLMKKRTIAEFKEVFGEIRSVTDGWGLPTEMHSSVSWLGFVPTQTNAIRVVSVFLFTVRKRETVKQKPTWTVDGITIEEGVFMTTGRKPKMEKYK